MCCWTDIWSTDRVKRGDPRCIRGALIYIISLICGSWWRHQMETFSVLLALCVGNSPVTGEFSAQRPLTRSFNVFFDLRQNEQLSRGAGDLRRLRAHYYVRVILWFYCIYMVMEMPCPWVLLLTHWGRDKMDAISQTTFSSVFSWMKMFEFRLQFHWSLFLRVQLTIFQHWFR